MISWLAVPLLTAALLAAALLAATLLAAALLAATLLAAALLAAAVLVTICHAASFAATCLQSPRPSGDYRVKGKRRSTHDIDALHLLLWRQQFLRERATTCLSRQLRYHAQHSVWRGLLEPDAGPAG
jgi:hypothetical protein